MKLRYIKWTAWYDGPLANLYIDDDSLQLFFSVVINKSWDEIGRYITSDQIQYIHKTPMTLFPDIPLDIIDYYLIKNTEMIRVRDFGEIEPGHFEINDSKRLSREEYIELMKKD